MENYNYEIVKADEDEDDTFSWNHFLKQLLVCSATVIMYFTFGMCMGAPTVFIPQLRREVNSTEVIDEAMASWLTSILPFAAIPWCVILPITAANFGRKPSHVIVTILFVVSNFVFYFGSNTTHIIIYEILAGAVGGAIPSICIMVLTEYTSPKYRGVILTFKSASFFWGVWVSNAIGTFFHWKNIALTTLILSFYPMIISVFFMPESPYYLSDKEKFDECIKSHKWLKGNGKAAYEELKRLLVVKQNTTYSNFKSIHKTIFRKSFYKPTLLGICIYLLFVLCGKYACTTYSIDIIKKMTSSESTAYIGMLILDGVSVFSMYVGSGLSHFIKRRTIFFTAASVGILTLFILSLYTYLVSLDVVADNKYVSVCLLSIFSIGACCGPMIFGSALCGELLPIEHRSLSMCIVALIEKCVLSIVTKTTPFVIRRFGLYTAFSGFALSSAVCLVLLYLYMPETKDKSLFEIKDMLLGNESKSKEEKKLCCTM